MDWPDGRQEAWRRTELKRLDLENIYTSPPRPSRFYEKDSHEYPESLA